MEEYDDPKYGMQPAGWLAMVAIVIVVALCIWAVSALLALG